MVLDPKLIELGKKLENDGLSDIKEMLVPALISEIESLSPSGARAIEAIVFGAVQSQIQAAVDSLVGKIQAAINPAPVAPVVPASV